MNDKQKLEALYDMTAHEGWGVLMEDLEKRVDAMKEGLVTQESTSYQLGLAHGHVKVYREFLALRHLIDLVLAEKQADEQAAAV